MASSSSPPPRSVVFIFDYDNTIVNCNSDEFIPAHLQSSRAVELISDWLEDDPTAAGGGRKGTTWTELMDSVVRCLQQHDGLAHADIALAAAQVPHFAEMLDVLRLAREHGQVHIVSDANDLYIKSFLQHHSIDVHGVHSNKFERDSALLYRVLPYHHSTSPHSCERCPANMCKTAIVKSILKEQELELSRVVYVGDGGNDFCPVVRALNQARGDVVFARDDATAAPHARGLVKRIERFPELVSAHKVMRWTDGRDLLQQLQAWLL